MMPGKRVPTVLWYCCNCGYGGMTTVMNTYCADCSRPRCTGCAIERTFVNDESTGDPTISPKRHYTRDGTSTLHLASTQGTSPYPKTTIYKGQSIAKPGNSMDKYPDTNLSQFDSPSKPNAPTSNEPGNLRGHVSPNSLLPCGEESEGISSPSDASSIFFFSTTSSPCYQPDVRLDRWKPVDEGYDSLHVAPDHEQEIKGIHNVRIQMDTTNDTARFMADDVDVVPKPSVENPLSESNIPGNFCKKFPALGDSLSKHEMLEANSSGDWSRSEWLSALSSNPYYPAIIQAWNDFWQKAPVEQDGSSPHQPPRSSLDYAGDHEPHHGSNKRKLNPNDEEDSKDTRKAKATKAGQSTVNIDEDSLLACHFHKMNPRLHLSCIHKTFKNISALNQHLHNDHRLGRHHCKDCWESFVDDHVLELHIEGSNCKPTGGVPVDRLGKVPKTRETQHYKWYWIWRQLFPNFPEPKTPYADELQVVDQFVQFLVGHVLPNSLAQFGTNPSPREIGIAIQGAALQWRSTPPQSLTVLQLPTPATSWQSDYEPTPSSLLTIDDSLTTNNHIIQQSTHQSGSPSGTQQLHSNELSTPTSSLPTTETQSTNDGDDAVPIYACTSEETPSSDAYASSPFEEGWSSTRFSPIDFPTPTLADESDDIMTSAEWAAIFGD
ncbi:hypothetical protein BJ170DRAFT_734866 [Xylariales sp. AK1849]|nr:hypothetical protein BJ170DRAFT_734866 [Xylariales sp. AK1849]